MARAWSKLPLATSYGSGRESRFTGHHGTNASREGENFLLRAFSSSRRRL